MGNAMAMANMKFDHCTHHPEKQEQPIGSLLCFIWQNPTL